MANNIIKIYNNHKTVFTLILIICNLVAFSLVYSSKRGNNFSETKEILQKNFSFENLETYFKNVAEKKGPEYAFDLLKIAPLPPETDVHLLAHAVGNILYKKEGVSGIRICTNDFRNACSHTIVIGAFIERGIDAIDDIADVCRKAPGGKGAYGMCFHGLGHGVLAYQEYDLRNAVVLCRTVGTAEYNYVESAECIGGVIMESIDGVHDPEAWATQKDTFFRKSDPLFPCNHGDWIPSNGRHNCFSYLTPHLLEAAGADLGNPTESDFEKAFSFCEKLIGDDLQYRESCYGGFGKEFVALVKSRDIRNVSEMTQEQLRTINNWCLLARDPGGIGACVRDVLNSLYWGGENKPEASSSFCGVIKETELQAVCYQHLAGIINYFSRGKSNLKKLCNVLPEDYREICNAKIPQENTGNSTN